jgi:predicted DNA-binding antitoxin AbrB/MazE fold protein
MTQVQAIYEGGVFKPLQEVSLPEKQRVTLSVQPIQVEDVLPWLAEVKELRRQLFERHGYLPDSTADIAEDRLRDA